MALPSSTSAAVAIIRVLAPRDARLTRSATTQCLIKRKSRPKPTAAQA
jgi:hypothetical protein